ncbi:MAG: hypothetical protein O2820_06245 [Planctomycetota bacterium]|nr:hypothetical protein [Planctomycetota bacterium]
MHFAAGMPVASEAGNEPGCQQRLPDLSEELRELARSIPTDAG